jgi:hypothetical protein
MFQKTCLLYRSAIARSSPDQTRRWIDCNSGTVNLKRQFLHPPRRHVPTIVKLLQNESGRIAVDQLQAPANRITCDFNPVQTEN